MVFRRCSPFFIMAYVQALGSKMWTSFRHSRFEWLLLQSITTLTCVLPYICSSIGMTFFQNNFMKKFHYPFVVVSCHLLFKFLMAALLRSIYKCWTGQSRPILACNVYVKRMSIVGIVSALDIGLSNWSYEFISVLLYTMTKSSSVIFILCFSILFGLERARSSLITVILFIATGLFMLTYKSTQFNMTGFLMVLAASLLGGIRWTMAQMLMQRNEYGMSNPIDMMYYIQPWMLVGLVPLALWFEGIPAYEEGLLGQFDYNNMTKIMAGCGLAFMIELCEYLLISKTSSLTLCIAGIFKEIITVVLAVWVHGEQISLLNSLGLMVCLFGITLHVWFKAKETTTVEKNRNNDMHLLIRVNQRDY